MVLLLSFIEIDKSPSIRSNVIYIFLMPFFTKNNINLAFSHKLNSNNPKLQFHFIIGFSFTSFGLAN